MESPIETRLNAGQQLLRLFADLGDSSPLIPAPLETISKVLDEIWSWSHSGAPNVLAMEFFSQVLTLRGHSTRILDILGTNRILSEQKGCAPMCNIPAESGLFAFAYWTGESDGDAWCYDINYNCIRCIPVGSGEADADRSRLNSYGVFPHFEHFVAYLRCEAERRGFIPSPHRPNSCG
jgi:hypothetical protein